MKKGKLRASKPPFCMVRVQLELQDEQGQVYEPGSEGAGRERRESFRMMSNTSGAGRTKQTLLPGFPVRNHPEARGTSKEQVTLMRKRRKLIQAVTNGPPPTVFILTCPRSTGCLSGSIFCWLRSCTCVSSGVGLLAAWIPVAFFCLHPELFAVIFQLSAFSRCFPQASSFPVWGWKSVAFESWGCM